MATLEKLVEQGKLEQLDGGLDEYEQPERSIYAFPNVIAWLENTLPTLEPILDEGRLSPMEQVDDFLHDFISGADFSYYKRAHFMDPKENGIWELKTTDVRFFGWFYKRYVFIAAEVNSAEFCKANNGAYAGHQNVCLHRLRTLELDEPKIIYGDYAYVL